MHSPDESGAANIFEDYNTMAIYNLIKSNNSKETTRAKKRQPERIPLNQ